MGLSREARALLDSAKRADSAPPAVRLRVRQRFGAAVAAGTISASAAIAQGTSLSALGTATQAGTVVAATSSFAATWVSAVVTGLALGAVAISPASKVPDESAVATTAVSIAPVRPAADMPARGRIAPFASSEPLPVEPQAAPTPTQAAAASERVQPGQGVQKAPSDKSLPEVAAVQTNPAPLDTATLPGSTTALDSVGVLPPSKASIARETELLAGVQRALQQNRPASALAMLNRYDKEFPAGMLKEESIASRVVALCKFGRGEDAARWRAEFFRRCPNSALSARVRAACRASELPGTKNQGTSK